MTAAPPPRNRRRTPPSGQPPAGRGRARGPVVDGTRSRSGGRPVQDGRRRTAGEPTRRQVPGDRRDGRRREPTEQSVPELVVVLLSKAIVGLARLLVALVVLLARAVAPVVRAVRARLRARRLVREQIAASPDRRAGGLCTAVGSVSALLALALVWLQVVNPERYVEKGNGQRTVRHELIGLRGSIMDRNGDAFSMSLPAKAVVADPHHVVDPAAQARVLAPLVGRDVATVEDLLRRPDTGFVYVRRQLEPELASRIDAMRLAGITIIDESRRFTTGGDLAQSVVGRMDAVGEQPSFGLEMSLDERLKGTNGERRFERGSDGGTIVGTERIDRRPTDGSDVVLTLDRNLQFLAEQVLGEQLVKLQAEYGTVIIGIPRTGEILAMANMVTTKDGGYRSARLNTAVRTYEPGSVMKVVTAAAAFEQEVVQPDEQLVVEPLIEVGGEKIHDSHRHPTQLMTVNQIFAESSNVGTIKIAQRLGQERILEYHDRFKFGQMTHLGLQKEQAGEYRREWSGSDIGSIPIGQSITATPLQVWNLYNMVANRGVYVHPKLVSHWTSPTGERTEAEVPPSERVLSEDAAVKVTKALQDVVEEGTGREWKIPGFAIAAKTGTSYQVWGDGYGYRNAQGQRLYAATFSGFFPASNPQLSITVMIHDPKTEHYGSTAAGPVFDRLAKESMRRYGIAGDAPIDDEGPLKARPAPAPTTTTTTTTSTTTTTVVPGGEPVAPVGPETTVPTGPTGPLTDDDIFRPDGVPPDALAARVDTAAGPRDGRPNRRRRE